MCGVTHNFQREKAASVQVLTGLTRPVRCWLQITYSLPAGSVPGVTGTSVYACYSKPSAYDRPWRAANDVLTVRLPGALLRVHACCHQPLQAHAWHSRTCACIRPWRTANDRQAMHVAVALCSGTLSHSTRWHVGMRAGLPCAQGGSWKEHIQGPGKPAVNSSLMWACLLTAYAWLVCRSTSIPSAHAC